MTSDPGPTAAATHNRLAASKSPYLLQHARNPVDWHPWDEKAFDLARSQDRLIFLSIGYSTCHWCHVMAHECFEDEEVAALLNRDYVAIKVDREERPDIDQVYMDVCQRMTGSGGWPLTIFMTPDALPFYAATYIPKQGRRERPGLLQLLPLISDKWRQDPALLKTTGQRIVDAVAAVSRPVAGELPDASIFDQAVKALQSRFDTRHAGFGRAPKFPRPHDLCFLLRRYRRTGQAELLEMVERTLVAMRCGGIYDQLGFGFHRYAVDEAWLVPHFEKMLYDQAGLLAAYTEAFQVTGRSLFARTAREIISYLKRDMMSPGGAFYSAEDADSEGVEGKFYVWNEAEIVDLLGEETADRFSRIYGVDAAGNFHDEATGLQTGANILHLSVPDLSDREIIPAETLSAARQRLFDARARRIRPHRDDKIVTAWNGMIISALARAGRILEEPQFLEDADRVVSFVMSKLRTADGRLLRCYRDGAGDIGGFAEDYAYFIRGLLDLYAADFRPGRLLQARALAAEMTRLFLDEGSGVLYDTAIDSDSLVVRPHGFWDGAMPAAGSVAMEVYLRLFQLTGDPDWRSRAESMLAAAAGNLARYPAGCTQWLQSAAWLLEPTREVVVAGEARSPAVEAMLAAAARPFAPETAILFRPEPLPDDLRSAAPFLAGMTVPEAKVLAYVCRNESCQKPLADPDSLQKLLGAPP